ADYTLQWQPVPGLWARLQSDGSTLAEALQAAAAVRFDQATRCAQPFAVGAVPAGLKVRYCQVALNDPAPVPRGGNVKPSTGATYGGSELDFGGATGRGLQLKV